MTDRSYASTAHPGRVDYDTVRPPPLRRISWGAVIAGSVIVIAVHFLLSLLGLGVGMTTVDPAAGATPQATSLGIGAGVWWVVSNLIALLLGGYVAARLSGVTVRGDGIIHGVLTWAVTLLITIYLLTTAVGSIVGGAFTVVQNTVSAAGQGLSQVAPQIAEATGISPDQLQARVEELLRPGDQATPQDPQSARRELIGTLTRMATGDEQAAQAARDRAITIISQQAGISPDEATRRIEEVENQIRQTVGQAAEAAPEAAETTANAVSSASIWAFIAFLLGAGAGAVGGIMGTRREAYVD